MGWRLAASIGWIAQTSCSPDRSAAIWTADALGLAPAPDPALRDRHYGSWTGRGLERLLVEEAGPALIPPSSGRSCCTSSELHRLPFAGSTYDRCRSCG